jgi:hypothetical protein
MAALGLVRKGKGLVGGMVDREAQLSSACCSAGRTAKWPHVLWTSYTVLTMYSHQWSFRSKCEQHLKRPPVSTETVHKEA